MFKCPNCGVPLSLTLVQTEEVGKESRIPTSPKEGIANFKIDRKSTAKFAQLIMDGLHAMLYLPNG